MTLGLLPARALPAATTAAWRPTRAGIIDLWQFAEQEFWFHAGRLILRGRNESGKTKALELLLPFLLDASLQPTRLDPFGTRSRPMRWNLLEGTDSDPAFPQRNGVSWCEFGRLDEGGEHYFTIGARMRATQGTEGVLLHLFVIDEARLGVGDDCSLTEVTPDGMRHVLSPERLTELLRGRGEVYDAKTGGRERYRARVNATLFGLDAERYAQLVEVLIHLRRPKLSAALSLETVQEWLTASLPPLDASIVAQQGDALEALRHAQEELASLRRSERLIGEFVGVYREYTGRVLAQRTAALRRAHSEYEAAGRAVTQADRDEEKAQGRVGRARRRRERAARIVAATKARLAAFDLTNADALEQLAKDMVRTVDEVGRATTRAGEAAGRLERAVRQAGNAHAGATEARDALVDGLRRAGARAAALAIARPHGNCADALAPAHDVLEQASYEASERALRELVSIAERRVRQLADLTALARRVTTAQGEASVAEGRRVDAAARAEAAAEAVASAETRTDDLLGDFADALFGFAVGAHWITLGEADIARVVEGVRVGNSSGNLLADAAGPARQGIADRRAALAAERRAVTAERTRTQELLAGLRAAAPIAPAPLRTRTHERTEADGTPFYALVDFAPALPPAQRAGLEAALEGAGLLDALVAADGALLAPDTFDVILDPDAPRAGARRTLADVLAPVEGLAVPPDRVRALLAAIALGPDGTVGVELDGRFRLGPMAGRYGKPEAEWIGQGARELTRQRRIDEAEATLLALGARDTVLDGLEAAVADDERSLAAELRAAPSDGLLVQARADHQAAVVAADAAEKVRKAAATEAQRLAREAERLRARLASDLDAAALTGRAADLETLRHEAELYRGDVTGLRSEAGSLARAASSLAAARADESDARRRDREATGELETARSQAGAAKSAHDAFERTAGADVRELLARRAAELARQSRLDRQGPDLEEAEREALAVARAAERDTGHARERQGELETARDAVAATLRETPVEFFALAFGEAPAESPLAWSTTAAVAAARRLERDFRFDAEDFVQREVDRFANEVNGRLGRITAEVPDYRIEVQNEAGLLVAYALREGRPTAVSGLREAIMHQIEETTELLAERERKLFEEFLLAELGRHLGERIRGARAIVRRMNDALEQVSTNSGDRVGVRWAPAADAGPDVAHAVSLLEKDPGLLPPEQLDALVAFFRGRVELARESEASGTWADQLTRVIDYRNWFAFTLEERRDGRTVPITVRSHGAGSGGEKSVKLHLPLFAILAAYYASAAPTAPRLLLLDEAFAGIDEGMRGRMFGLLARFGFSFLMTSEREWGMYPQLDGTAIYVLNRHKDLRGVLAEHFVWDGDTRTQVGEPA